MLKTVFKVGLLAAGTTALLAAVGSYFVVKYNDANNKGNESDYNNS